MEIIVGIGRPFTAKQYPDISTLTHAAHIQCAPVNGFSIPGHQVHGAGPILARCWSRLLAPHPLFEIDALALIPSLYCGPSGKSGRGGVMR